MSDNDVMVAAMDAGFGRDWVLANKGKLVRMAVLLNATNETNETPPQEGADDATS